MSQSEQIKIMLENQEWVCSGDIIERMKIIDYRRRICDLKKKGLSIKSEPCRGRCGRSHISNMYRYQLIPAQAVIGWATGQKDVKTDKPSMFPDVPIARPMSDWGKH